jgi:hypothetical protein
VGRTVLRGGARVPTVGVAYTNAKNKRWGLAYKQHPDLETLAAYARQQAAEKAKPSVSDKLTAII